MPLPIIADFGQHPGSEDGSCPRQAVLTGSPGKEYLAVRMLFEKLLDLLLIAFDLSQEGLKFRASNSKKRNFNEAKLERATREIEEKVKEYLAKLDDNDKREAGLKSPGAEDLSVKDPCGKGKD